MANYLDHVVTNQANGEKIVYIKPGVVSHTTAGLMSPSDKIKLDGITDGANKYVLPVASSAELGGLKISYTNSGANVALQLNDENRGYVRLTKAAIQAALGYLPENPAESGDEFTLTVATSTELGGIKIGYSDSGAKIAVKLNGSNKAYTELTAAAIEAALGYTPANEDNDYTLPIAGETELGGLRIKYTDSGATIGLKLDRNARGYVELTEDAIIDALGYTPQDADTVVECTLDAVKVLNKEYDDSIITDIVKNM